MQLLTTGEAAAYLRLKERKLYELVADDAIPCTKVTGRWLFPKDELDQWLSSSVAHPEGMGAPAPPPIVGGSHDPLLEWALRQSGSGLAILAEGTEAGFERLAEGEVVAAAIHFHSGDKSADANVEALRRAGRLRDAVLINFLRREQGLLLAAGNPLGIESLADALNKRARFALRPKGAGAQQLLELLLYRAGTGLSEIASTEPPCPTGSDLAQAVRAGHADCGIATRSAANGAGLAFIPLLWEWFDLALHPRDYFRPPMSRLLHFMRSTAFGARAEELGGYDTSATAEVRFAP